MQRYTKQQARDQYTKLPRVLKEAIFSEEIAEKLYDIGHRNGLNIEKTGFLAEESGYVVLGLTRPREFVGQLIKRLEVTTDKAKEIAGQVNHEIFFPLHEALKQTHGVDVREETIEKAEPLIHEQPRTSTPTDVGAARTDNNIKHEQREPIKTQGETIDLRQQYRPRIPDLPPSKVPPINLRAQREGVPQGGIIPKQGISFPPKKHEPQRSPAESETPRGEQTPHQSFQHGAGQARTVPPAAGTRTPLEQAQTGRAARTDGAGENVKTSPFGISSGRLIEDLEKKMQPPPLEELRTKNLKLGTEVTSPSNVPHKEEAPKTPESEKSPVSPPPPNIPLKEESEQKMNSQDPKAYDPYREPTE